MRTPKQLICGLLTGHIDGMIRHDGARKYVVCPACQYESKGLTIEPRKSSPIIERPGYRPRFVGRDTPRLGASSKPITSGLGIIT